MNPALLIAQRDETRTRARAIPQLAIDEARAITAEERAEFDRLLAQADGLDATITMAQQTIAWEVAQVEAQSKPGAIRQTHDYAAERPFESLGHQLQAIYQATVNGDVSSRQRLMAAASGSSEAVSSDGGFLLQPDFAQGIEEKMHDIGQVLALCNPIPVSGNALVTRRIDETSRADGSRWGGIRGYWVDEAVAPSATRPKFGKRTTPLVKVAALGYSTDELLEDFPAMSAIFERGFAEELVFKVEDALINGTGGPMPLGLLQSPALITVDKETGQAADTILTTNLSKMWARMYESSEASAVWLINQELGPQLDELSIPAGTAALEPRFVTYGPDGILRIKGRPVIEVEYCSALGDLGDIVLADFGMYELITKSGIQQASSMHVLFATDEMAFRAVYRVGGQPMWEAPLTPYKGTNTVSPFVTLQAR